LARSSAEGIDMRPDLEWRDLEWRDLAVLPPREIAAEVALPLPWLALSLAFAAWGWWVAALPCSFYFFLCGLRQCHDCFHDNWGGRRRSDATLAVLSVAMLGSMHAVRLNHLRHHAHCLGPDDIEGRSARMNGLGAILFGPCFPILLHWAAWRGARRRQRCWIAAELGLNLAWLAAVFAVLDCAALRYHTAAMGVGQCLTAFFAVWTVHRDCAGSPVQARSLRCRWKSLVAHDMFFHVEHHLCPRVPTRHLPELARRLDVACPGLSLPQVY
jgi:fatty acid desaturase